MAYPEIRHSYWVLDGRIPRPVSPAEWRDWIPGPNSTVRSTWLPAGGDRTVNIATVFVGVVSEEDFQDGPVPRLFETVMFRDATRFRPARVVLLGRYRTWDEAEEGHTLALLRWDLRWVRLLRLTLTIGGVLVFCVSMLSLLGE